MTCSVYRSSRPHSWIVPRPHVDPHQRYHTYGPIRPMEEPGLFRRLLRRLS